MLNKMTIPPPLFVGEIEITFDGSVVKLTGMMAAEDAGTRPVAQLVMSEETFRRMLAHGRRKLSRDLH